MMAAQASLMGLGLGLGTSERKNCPYNSAGETPRLSGGLIFWLCGPESIKRIPESDQVPYASST